MSKYYSINGYYLDGDKEEFEGYIVKEFDDMDEEEGKDDDVFFFGMGEDDIIQAIEDGEDNSVDFVITSYEEIFDY